MESAQRLGRMEQIFLKSRCSATPIMYGCRNSLEYPKSFKQNIYSDKQLDEPAPLASFAIADITSLVHWRQAADFSILDDRKVVDAEAQVMKVDLEPATVTSFSSYEVVRIIAIRANPVSRSHLSSHYYSATSGID